MGSITWDAEIAEIYDETYAALAEPSVLDPMTSVLAGLAGDGPALEFAVGTGRVALALSARGSLSTASNDDQIAVFEKVRTDPMITKPS